MKAKKFILGLTFFAIGIIATLGTESNLRHYNSNHQPGIRKSTTIEVGAPLKVSELRSLGLL
jgi:hypothetical protein